MTKITCPKCKSEKIDIASRIVGYFSRISNWGAAKLEELKHREKGNYTVKKDESTR